MKRLTLLIIMITSFHNIQAFTCLQNEPVKDTIKLLTVEKPWNLYGIANLNFNQVSFSNWAAGGSNALSGTAVLSLNADYKKNKVSFENSGIFGYGMTQSTSQGTIKMDDRIEINSKLNYKASEYWNYSLLSSLKTQFAPGYNYPDKVNVVSNFFAPGYLFLSLGMDYRPTKYFSLFMSPATGKFTFVLDQKLADSGAYGVRKADLDLQGNLISHGQTVRSEFGMLVNAFVKYEIMKNIVLDSRLILFDNYTDKDIRNRWNVDVDFETNIIFVINSIFSATFNSRFLYDENINVPLYDMVNGQQVKIGAGPRLQIKEAFGLGLLMKLGAKKKVEKK